MKRDRLVQRLSDGKFLSAHCAAFTIWRSDRDSALRCTQAEGQAVVAAMWPGCRGSEPKGRVAPADATEDAAELSEGMTDAARAMWRAAAKQVSKDNADILKELASR